MGCFWEWVEGSSPVATNIELNTSQSPAPHFHTHHPWLHTIPVMELCREKAFLMLFLHLLKSPSTIQHKLTLPPNVTTEKYRAEEARREGKRKWVWKTGDRGKITNHVTMKWIKKDSNIRQYRFIYFALNSTLHGALLFCYLESAKRFLQQKYFIVLLKIILKCPLSNF